MSRTILRIDSSATGTNSATRALTSQVIERVAAENDTIVVRDLALGVPQIDADVTANSLVAPDARSAESAQALAFADQLIAELQDSDVLVIGAPIYNFAAPAVLKAWADLVARAGTTFTYTEQGAKGLLADRPTYIVTASGGTPIGSSFDFGTTWLTGFLAFIGITDVHVIAAEGLAMDAEGAMSRAAEAIAAIA